MTLLNAASKKLNMTNKSILIILLLLSVYQLSLAQALSEDVLYLKDGSILRGNIVEQYRDSLVKLQMNGGSIFAISTKLIGNIEYNAKPYQPDLPPGTDMPDSNKNSGYFNITAMGVLPGSNYYYDYYYGNPQSGTSVGFTIQTIHGYRFNKHLLAGAGLAIDIIQYPMGQLFADGRYEILDRKTTPFVFIDCGYGIPLSKGHQDANSEVTYSGGITAGGGAGMRINFRNEGAFILEAGYKMEKASENIKYETWGTDQTNNYTYSRLAIRVGLAF